MEETISLKDIFQTLKKRLVLIIGITAAAVAVSALVSYFLLTPMYQSSTQILVNKTYDETNTTTSADVRTNLELINTYNEIIISPRILDPVIEETGINASVSQIRNMVSVNSHNDSQVVSIRVESEDPAQAVELANTIALVFQRDIVELMNVDNVSILSSAELSENPSPISPNPTLNMAIAFVVGMMGAVGLAFLLEFLDNTLKDEEGVEEALGLPVLASIAPIDIKTVDVKELRDDDSRLSRTGRGNLGA
ncbi:capsular biosynthesis protein [Alteribacter lacisalsi]|uniref:Capsular biosynthesis protein n=1 Tax=Alteribacter lacisalsi TaxID=2045244 RepID=A0A2W0H2J1_9BACI|nr:Wzz/FepE/Etk N-terminal domain-containing protein [Alteribacter lacisalsi]PYZ96014.1 capsular biosynthesis protein [Alteribacter lacisalsi]